MAQVVERLHSKHKTLSSNSCTTKNKRFILALSFRGLNPCSVFLVALGPELYVIVQACCRGNRGKQLTSWWPEKERERERERRDKIYPSKHVTNDLLPPTRPRLLKLSPPPNSTLGNESVNRLSIHEISQNPHDPITSQRPSLGLGWQVLA
jgi:hypothetical protein